MSAPSFCLVTETLLNGRIPVKKYKSNRTGLTVVFAEVDGPVCNGYFVLATEAHDDDGLPHTLEHLIFLGSELYPYKGALDLLANRCLASGTNAWTDTDHTCYTMTTAGSGGFLSLLPIYLDHILFPTLADSGFITEVHHINGDGEDAGVVYCEMQGRENMDSSRAHLELLRAAYPGSGYSSETGGIMHNLRTSCNNEKVRAYHRDFYRAENLTIIITGQVDHEAAFKAIDSVEKRILEKPKLPEFKRPWQTPIAPLECSKDLKILYPSDEEDSGLVYVAWRGPQSATEQTTLTACSLLLRYLTQTSISPLQQEFVEIEDPLASGISYSMVENTESLLYVEFENVPVDKMEEIKPKLMKQLCELAKGDGTLNMTRMKTIIDKMIQETYCSLEDSPHDAAAFMIIGDVLYGQTQEDFEKRLNVISECEHLRAQPESFWVDLLKKYITTGHSIVIRAYPSVEEQKRMAKEEADRVAVQREKLGPKGLEEKRCELLKAIEANEGCSPGVDVLTSVPVPSVEDIKFHSWSVHRPGASTLEFPIDDFPYFTECYDCKTSFIYLNVSLDTQFLSPEERLYLPLFLELAMESPVKSGDTIIPYEDVVMALESDTVSNFISVGWQSSQRYYCGPFSNYVFWTMQVIPENYEKAVKWARDILFNTVFTAERIRVCAAKLANDIAQAKRMGEKILYSLIKCIVYKEDSNVQQSSLVLQQKFLTKLIADLECDPEAAVKALYGIRNKLTVPSNLRLHLAADWTRLRGKPIVEPWIEQFPNRVPEAKAKLTVIPDWVFVEPNRKVGGKMGAVLGMGSVESSFLLQVVPSIKDFSHPDLPAVMLFLQYLTQLEGSMWKNIRGKGFAYSYSMQPRPNEGVLQLQFYKATNVVGAYRETKKILEETLKGNCLDQTLFESARSSLIFEVIDREKSVGDLPGQGILCTMKDVRHDYNRQLVKNIGKVDKESLIEIGKKYVLPLFCETARSAVVCSSEKAEEIRGGLEGMGLPLDIQITVEESMLSKGSR